MNALYGGYYDNSLEYGDRSDDWEIAAGEKFTTFTNIFGDAYIFVVYNDNGMYDTGGYDKHDLF